MPPKFASSSSDAVPIHVVESDSLDAFLSDQPERVASWVAASGFTAGLGTSVLVPSETGTLDAVIAGYGSAAARARGRFHLSNLANTLPDGAYRFENLPSSDQQTEALGWLLASYRFSRYKQQTEATAHLIAPENVDATRIETIAAGEYLTRDLINTPAFDMGPGELEAAATELASTHGAQIHVITGEALLEQNFPMIHTVGRAAEQAPRLIDTRWGTSGPKLTLVGKGVCFDTGGLNLKPGGSMGLMKKDMGGSATVLGLAHMIMALDMPLQLRVLIPAVENAVSGNAYRPGDILTARDGKTVEINNTDAEGRLVLADALALGAEECPDLMVSMATLTGAARVAVGADLAPFFSDNTGFARALEDASDRVGDPVWRLPLHKPYEAMIEPGIADLDNAPKGGFAGAITAALFLRRFAGDTKYAHFDVYCWSAAAQPGRPKGGVGMGARALLDALPEILEL